MLFIAMMCCVCEPSHCLLWGWHGEGLRKIILFPGAVHLCQQVLYWVVQFNLQDRRWHLWERACCGKSRWIDT